MSRLRFPLPLLAIAALLAMATGLVACGGGDSSDENPQAVLDGATLEGVDSADLDLALGIKASGEEGGQVDVDLSGPFQAGGHGEQGRDGEEREGESKSAQGGAS